MMLRICIFLAAAFAALLSPGSLVAQPSHVERLQDAARACLGSIPADVEVFRLEADSRAPYIRSALVTTWLTAGKTVLGASESDAEPDPEPLTASLSYVLDRVGITFVPGQDGLLDRHAVVGMSYRLEAADRRILADSRCDRTLTDPVSRELAEALRDSRWPETDIVPESGRSWHSFVKPVLVLGAAAVGTWLFFNLRSERAEDG